MIERLFERNTKTEERSGLGTIMDLGLGGRTKAGVNVTPDSAMTFGAVWACVRVISESVAGLPLFVYRRAAGGRKERSPEHPVYRLLHDQPNPEMSAFEMREMMAAHVETWGNAYASIEWSRSGQAVGLWPLNPGYMEAARRVNGELWYGYRVPGGELRWLNAGEVLHVRGLSGDGVFGYSPVRHHIETIGLGKGLELHGATFFGNGARPGGLLYHPGRLSAEAYNRIMASFSSNYQGIENAHRLKILEEGMTYQSVGIPPEEAQFLESRKFQVTEIARIYNVPPHMIQDLERATFSNVEQQSINFVVHSLRPRLVRLEKAFQRQLMTEQERQSYYVEHLVDGLLRGDIQSRYAAYNTAILAGFMSRNEVRKLENLNPAEGLDSYLVPLNMVESGDAQMRDAQMRGGDEAAEQATQRVAPTGQRETRNQAVAGDRRRLAGTQFDLMVDVFARIVRREVNDVRRAVVKYLERGTTDVEGLLLWLGEFYEEHAEFIETQSLPVMNALGRLVLADVAREMDAPELVEDGAEALSTFMAAYVSTMGVRWILGNRGQLEAIIRDGPTAEETLGQLLQARLDGWAENEAQKTAMRESVQAVNAAAKASYRAAGVTRLRWVASGSENCPYCQALDGRIVGIEENFVEAGDFAPDGAKPLKVRRSVGHPPVHQGCDCSIVAA